MHKVLRIHVDTLFMIDGLDLIRFTGFKMECILLENDAISSL